MLVLDTNVVSELMRPRPDPRVLVATQPLSEVAIATITVVEIRVGIAMLPQGRRRAELES